jgi:DNA-binding response OmpR family regulator
MIVGVDSDFVYLMQYYAKKSGCQAVVSAPDSETLGLAKRRNPALIVLEADLADAVGWEILRSLKSDQATQHIPVAVCSWLDDEESELAAEAAFYLQKPVLYGDFVAASADVVPTSGL